MVPPLVVVAHGSRDPRSAAAIRALARSFPADGPEIHVSFLDLSEPSLTDVLRGLHARGHRHVVVVPLLLGSAYHARVDLPALVASVPGPRVTVSPVLGPDPVLAGVAFEKVVAAGADPGDPGQGVVLAAAGSSHAPANAAVALLARQWARRHRMRVVPAFASAARPDMPAAVARLWAQGARRLAVASWFLAPGRLPDRIETLAREADAGVRLAGPLTPDPRVASVVLARYHQSLAPVHLALAT